VRADRLVAILLLLQRRAQVTAAEVAAELEISPRTARRDLEALGVAGLPVYSIPGRRGGWRLAGGGRTDLSGLSAAEAQALFVVAGPSASATPELKAALRKLVRALPEPLRTPAERAASTMVVDQLGWGERPSTRRAPPLLDRVRDAVVHGRQVRLDYTSRVGDTTSRVIEPLGMAAKAGTWYLVADTASGLRTFRLDRIISIEATGEAAAVPDGFDLSQAWALIADRVEELRTPVVARALVRPEALAMVAFVMGERVRIGGAEADGRVEVELRGHHLRELLADVGGLGLAVEVIEPQELKTELAALGRDLLNQYGPARKG
jgi:predicted DNA-binding transcriptional regulator YafY